MKLAVHRENEFELTILVSEPSQKLDVWSSDYGDLTMQIGEKDEWLAFEFDTQCIEKYEVEESDLFLDERP